MADKFLSKFCKENQITMNYKNPFKNRWLINNSKISLNKIPGLFEFKKDNNLIEYQFLSCQIDENISYKKILYVFKNSMCMKKFKHVEHLNRIKLLRSFFYVNVIKLEELEYVPLNFYDYIIKDDCSNFDKADLVLKEIRNLSNNKKSNNINVNDFINVV